MKRNLLYIVCSKKFKYYFILTILLFILSFVSATSYVSAVSKNIASNVFRLHVIANSDSQEDQQLKYIVRDKILEYVNDIGQNASSKEELISMLNLNEIQKIAKDTVEKQGYSYDVSVEIGNFSFPTKQYGDISLPAGFYDALEVKIGSAKGKNWWCVMFPPLCFVDVSSGIVPDNSKETLKNSMNEEEYKLISDTNDSEMNFKFKIIELFNTVNTKLAKK